MSKTGNASSVYEFDGLADESGVIEGSLVEGAEEFEDLTPRLTLQFLKLFSAVSSSLIHGRKYRLGIATLLTGT